MKRLVAPRTWPIQRKKYTFVSNPLPSGAKFKYGVTLSFILKELIGVCKTNKEVKLLITDKKIKVNNSTVKNARQLVSLFQLLDINGKKYRIELKSSGKLNVVEAENEFIINKVMNKTILNKGKIQVNMFDGRNFILDEAKDIKVGDSIAFQEKSYMILPLQKNAIVVLFDGKHRGMKGKIENIEGNSVVINSDNHMIKTLKKYCFVVSKANEKPVIKLE